MEAIRNVRVFESEMFDWIATFAAALLLSMFFPHFIYQTLGFVSPLQFYASMVPLGVLVHWASGSETPMTKELLRPGVNIVKCIALMSIIVVFYESNSVTGETESVSP